MYRRLAATTVLAGLLCATSPAAAHAATGPTVGTVTVRVRPGSVLQLDGRRQLLLTARTDTAMCSYKVWRGDYVPLAPPSWTLLAQKTLSTSTTAFRYVDNTPSLADKSHWLYQVQAVGCDGQAGPYTQVGDTWYGVSDDPAISLTGPAQVVTSPLSFGGSHHTATGIGTEVDFNVGGEFNALYARPGPDGGVATIYESGVQVGTISFYAPTVRPPTEVWQHKWVYVPGKQTVAKVVMTKAGAGGGTAMTFDALTDTSGVIHGA